ncbi:MAG: hypothetical protein IJ583_13870 [Firmicutes bacterium]|nr:hypothetical protein [Bacillota bacterium]
MARKSNLSIEEQIEKKEAEITSLNEQLKNAKNDLKKLKDDKQLADTQRLLSAIEASGKSVDDVLNMLNNQ